MSQPKIVSPLKHLCKQCQRFYPEAEVFIGLCQNCLNDRTRSACKPLFNTDGRIYKCSECNRPVFLGFTDWDTLSKEFLLLCGKCTRNKVEKDSLYKNTEYAYTQKKAISISYRYIYSLPFWWRTLKLILILLGINSCLEWFLQK